MNCFDCKTPVPGRAKRCKPCISERLRAYRASRKDVQREINRRYYAEHGEDIKRHKRMRHAALKGAV